MCSKCKDKEIITIQLGNKILAYCKYCKEKLGYRIVK